MEAKLVPGMSSEELMRALEDMEPDAKKDGEISANEWAEQTGMSYDQAKWRLNKKVEDGLLERGIRIDPLTGRKLMCYWPK